MIILQREPIIELASCDLAKPVVLFSRHSYIDVIVPRYEASVTHRP